MNTKLVRLPCSGFLCIGFLCSACSWPRQDPEPPSSNPGSPIQLSVASPLLELYQCDHPECGRKERWFQPHGEIAHCSCASGKLDQPCNCEHHALGCYRARAEVNLTPGPPPEQPALDVWTAALRVRATCRDTFDSSEHAVGIDATTVTCRRVVDCGAPDGAVVLLDRDDSMLAMPTQPEADGTTRTWTRHLDLRGDYRLEVEVRLADVPVPIHLSVPLHLGATPAR